MLALSIVWLFKTIKYILFWVYLWQLKEYHVGRFRDHFRTKKGNGIIFNYFLVLQVILIILLGNAGPYTNALSFILLAIYLFQFGIFASQLVKNTAKMPVRTSKTLLLTVASLGAAALFFAWSLDQNPAWLILFDILLPLVVSLIVLLFQPFSVLARNAYVKRARTAMKQFTQVRVVAITGSYGKTSTKEFLTTILSKKYKVLAKKIRSP